ncbi:hypothetical protein V1478_000317, partial [Vespula squamosa]
MLRKQRGITVEEIQQALSEEEGMMRTNDKEHPSGMAAYWRDFRLVTHVTEHRMDDQCRILQNHNRLPKITERGTVKGKRKHK